MHIALHYCKLHIGLHYCKLQHCTARYFIALSDCTISLHCTALSHVATFHCTVASLHYLGQKLFIALLQDCTIWGRQERQSSCRQQSGCSLPLSHSLSRDEDEDENNELTNKQKRRREKTNKQSGCSFLSHTLFLMRMRMTRVMVMNK